MAESTKSFYELAQEYGIPLDMIYQTAIDNLAKKLPAILEVLGDQALAGNALAIEITLRMFSLTGQQSPVSISNYYHRIESGDRDAS